MPRQMAADGGLGYRNKIWRGQNTRIINRSLKLIRANTNIYVYIYI